MTTAALALFVPLSLLLGMLGLGRLEDRFLVAAPVPSPPDTDTAPTGVQGPAVPAEEAMALPEPSVAAGSAEPTVTTTAVPRAVAAPTHHPTAPPAVAADATEAVVVAAPDVEVAATPSTPVHERPTGDDTPVPVPSIPDALPAVAALSQGPQPSAVAESDAPAQDTPAQTTPVQATRTPARTADVGDVGVLARLTRPRHWPQRHGGERRSSERHGTVRVVADRVGSERRSPGRRAADRHDSRPRGQTLRSLRAYRPGSHRLTNASASRHAA